MANKVNVETPYFFLVTEQYAIGTSGGIEKSERTIDVSFDEFAQNIGLQKKLHLGSTVLAEPVWNPPLAYPLRGDELKKGVATYMAAFSDNPQERKRRENYLMNNGLIRILVTDDELRKEIIPQVCRI